MAFLIGIAGGSGAGKTTLARAVSGAFPATMVIEEDDYYHCASVYPRFDAATHNFDTPDAKDHAALLADLARARAGLPFEKPLYDFTTHTRRPERQAAAPAPVVIVEGLFTLASPALRAAFDLRVFVEAPENVRLARRLARDVAERGRTPESVRAQFNTTTAPMHERYVAPQKPFADLVFNAEKAGPAEIEAFTALVRARLPAAAKA